MIDTNFVHLGDCIEFMKTMPDKSVDLICTDPPYGIDFKYDKHEDSFDGWKALMAASIPEWLRICRGPILFPGCSIKGREWLWKNYPPRWTLCWFKGSPGHRAAVGFNDWEDIHVLGEKIHRNAHDHFYAKPTDAHIDWHPCPKSEEYAKWIISRFSEEGEIVFDPFAGSGTSLVVAEKLGRKWIGCEMSPDYHKGIMARVGLELSQGKLF